MSAAPAPLVRVERLCKSYEVPGGRPVPVLFDVSLAIFPGEHLSVMGPSGSGKSTFMNILGCLDAPSSGSYFLEGRDVARLAEDELAELRNRRIGFVFQGFNLLRRVSTVDNAALPLLYAGLGRAEARGRAREVLAQLGLEGYLDALPSQLSGGQQQRVAIARALATSPSLVLADEPTGNLDSRTSGEIMELFTRLNRERGITLVVVTHESDVARYGRRLVRFVDGRVVHDGEVEP